MPTPPVSVDTAPEFSQAGYFPVPDSPRMVANFNRGWRFAKGRHPGAEQADFDAAEWELVNVPHGVDGVLADNASGSSNYQGPAVYRKVFTPGPELAGRRVVLHFDGVLGKSRYWFNGELRKEHHSGFLPAIVDITEGLLIGSPNVVTVIADNSDDPSYPPGKPQTQLDFSYFGGMYRNAYLVASDPIHISNPNEVDIAAGGGVFAVTEKIDRAGAHMRLKVHLRNTRQVEVPAGAALTMQVSLLDDSGVPAASARAAVVLPAGGEKTQELSLLVKDPRCWSPETPTLYRLEVRVLDAAATLLDAVALNLGIRTVELDPTRGLVLNGALYRHKLIGANRHQDFAQLGFAVPDALHWRDALKLRNAGMRIVRNAHYPQSPAFMDACDALGLFVIVNTPGWQFWNPEPPFEERVYGDIRYMVRRDRNRPSVLMWEPILNETRYPESFAHNAHEVTHAEYPFPGCYTAADSLAKGSGHFDVLFGHPPETGMAGDEADSWADREASGKVWFTREWGDNVDDWTAQNSPSRVARNWGEVPQLVQAKHYGQPDYPFTSLQSLHATPAHHLGWTLWHSFDHQRGYHPDPFYGGIMDSYRRPKLSYELFKAQRPEPSVHIGHFMTPFSPADVSVFAQAESVRLFINEELVGEEPAGRHVAGAWLPAPIVTFKDVYSVMNVKAHVHHDSSRESSMRAEAVVAGQVVATHRINRARRAVAIEIELDTEGVALVADGSSAVVVVASLRDSDGTIKRLNNGEVDFQISGAASLVSGSQTRAPISWGEACTVIRLHSGPGPVRIVARYAPAGPHMPAAGVLDFDTVAGTDIFIDGEDAQTTGSAAAQQQLSATPQQGWDVESLRLALENAEKENHRLRNREVEIQQQEFGAP